MTGSWTVTIVNNLKLQAWQAWQLARSRCLGTVPFQIPKFARAVVELSIILA